MTMPLYAGSAATAAGVSSLATLSAYTVNQQTVDSESPTLVAGLALAVGSGPSYRFRAVIPFVCNSAHAAYLFMAGPSASFFAATIRYLGGSAGSAAESQVAFQTILGTNTGCDSTLLSAGQDYVAEIDGVATFAAEGGLVVNAAASANVNTFTIQPGAVLDVWQVLS